MLLGEQLKEVSNNRDSFHLQSQAAQEAQPPQVRVMLRLAVSHGVELRLRSGTEIGLEKFADALSSSVLSEDIVGSSLVRRRTVCNTYSYLRSKCRHVEI